MSCCKEGRTCLFLHLMMCNSHLYSNSLNKNTTKHSVFVLWKCIIFLSKMLKKPHLMVTGSIPPTTSPWTHSMDSLKSPLARQTYYICSLIQLVKEPLINYENAKTFSQSIHLLVCLLDTVHVVQLIWKPALLLWKKETFTSLYRGWTVASDSDLIYCYWRKTMKRQLHRLTLRTHGGTGGLYNLFVLTHARICLCCLCWLFLPCQPLLVWTLNMYNISSVMT